jgi:hypothetical protein
MKVKEAKEIARSWVQEKGQMMPEFRGAFFVGSVNWKAEEAPWPLTSDIDICILVDQEVRTWQRIFAQGVVLEVSVTPYARFKGSPESILSDFRYACHFSRPSIIADPTGQLNHLHKVVAQEYAKRSWVQARCEHARGRLVDFVLGEEFASAFKLGDTLWEQLFHLYYGVLMASEILAIAGLKDPTIRKCLVVSHDLLEVQGRLDIQEALVAILGCTQMDREQVERHLRHCTAAFDRAAEVVQTPFFGSQDITALSRSLAIDGAKEIIDLNLCREAIFWIHTIYSHAQKAIQNDGSEDDKKLYLNTYIQMLEELDLSSKENFGKRMTMLHQLTPEIMRVATSIIYSNPAITS